MVTVGLVMMCTSGSNTRYNARRATVLNRKEIGVW
jgi:hypothetical protein